jgi:hypothetical protein
MSAPQAPTIVLASCRDMAHARAVIDALQYAGVEASLISMHGEGVDAARRADARANSSHTDIPLVWRVFWRGALWSVIATPLGGLLGLALGLAGFVAINLVVTALLWALVAHLVGGMVGAYMALGMGDAWALTFHRTDGGAVTVTVACPDAAAAARAERIIRAKDPLAIATTA